MNKSKLIVCIKTSFLYNFFDRLAKKFDVVEVFANSKMLAFCMFILNKFSKNTILKCIQICSLIFFLLILAEYVAYIFNKPSASGLFVRSVFATAFAFLTKKDALKVINESWVKTKLDEAQT